MVATLCDLPLANVESGPSGILRLKQLNVDVVWFDKQADIEPSFWSLVVNEFLKSSDKRQPVIKNWIFTMCDGVML